MRTKKQILGQIRGVSAALADTIPAESEFGVLALDDRNQIVFWDELCTSMFGWQCPEVTQQNVSVLLKDGLTEESTRFFQRPTGPGRGEKCAFRVTAQRKDRSEFAALLVKTPRQGDSSFLWMAVFPALPDQTPAVDNASDSSAENQSNEFQLVSPGPEPASGASVPPPESPSDLDAIQPRFETSPDGTENIREKVEAFENERKDLLEQVSKYYFELEQTRATLRDERETRQQLEEKLKDVMSAGLVQARHALKGDPAATKDNGAASKRVERLEEQLRAITAELETAKAKLAATKQSVEKGSVVDLQGQVEEAQTELAEAERRVREGVTSLARSTADFEKERAERRRFEERSTELATQVQTMHEQLRQHLESERANQNKASQLETELHDRESIIIELKADLQKQTVDLQLAEEQLKNTADMSRQFQESLKLFEDTKQAFLRTEQQLTSSLEASAKALTESEARLQKEIKERQDLAAALEKLQAQFQQDTGKNAAEVARLQSALQVEQLSRKQLEGAAVQSRYGSVESARADRVLLNRLRTRVREPMDKLLRSTRGLLEVELKDDQKKLVESILEEALLLKSNFQEVSVSAEPAEAK